MSMIDQYCYVIGLSRIPTEMDVVHASLVDIITSNRIPHP
jgi:hypothetical protein